LTDDNISEIVVILLVSSDNVIRGGVQKITQIINEIFVLAFLGVIPLENFGIEALNKIKLIIRMHSASNNAHQRCSSKL